MKIMGTYTDEGPALATGSLLPIVQAFASKADITVQSCDTGDQATRRVLEQGKSPARKIGQIDNRGSHLYLSLCWAQALAQQCGTRVWRARFAALAERLVHDEGEIISELLGVHGSPADLGGHYYLDPARVDAVMRPSLTFTAALATLCCQGPLSSAPGIRCGD